MSHFPSMPGRCVALLLLIASPVAAQVTSPPQPPPGDTAVRVMIGVVGEAPAPNQALGVDAEVRMALHELLGDNPIPALSRLQWLQNSPVAMEGVTGDAALRGREDLLFLLAETYYRLGMDDAFRMAAQQLTSDAASGRYTAIIRSQLLLDAYRRGDHAAVVSISRTLSGNSSVAGLAALVTGLSSYQTGDYTAAGTSFAAARATGEPYAGYAQYMEVLARLRTDTTQTAPALASLRTLAQSAQGEFRDQVRLTASQLAYEGGDYATAASLAGEIAETGPFGAQALFTRAWALYNGEQLQAAHDAFARFASQFPQLPQRDESRLMAAQVLLQLGRTADAAQLFNTIAVSAQQELTSIQGQASGSMQQAAQALVEARAAGLLFITDPASGKTISLTDAAGADASVLAAIFSNGAATVPPPARPELVSLAEVARRLEAVGGPLREGVFPRRVLFTMASGSDNRAQYGERARALFDADVTVALVRHRLNEQLGRQQAYLALMQRLQQQLDEEMRGFTTVSERLEATRDSLERLNVILEAASVRLRQMFLGQIAATRLLAEENVAAIDSIQRVLGGAGVGNEHVQLLQMEAQTAAHYRSIADITDAALNGLIDRHPAFALRDSVSARGQAVLALLAETQGAANMAGEALRTAVSELQNMETEQVRTLRAALAAAEARRGSAEAQLVQIVDAELRLRANQMVASLRRDAEAAEFASASALFFITVDSDETVSRGAGTPDSPNQVTLPPPGAASQVPPAGGTTPPPAAPPAGTGMQSGAAVPPPQIR